MSPFVSAPSAPLAASVDVNVSLGPNKGMPSLANGLRLTSLRRFLSAHLYARPTVTAAIFRFVDVRARASHRMASFAKVLAMAVGNAHHSAVLVTTGNVVLRANVFEMQRPNAKSVTADVVSNDRRPAIRQDEREAMGLLVALASPERSVAADSGDADRACPQPAISKLGSMSRHRAGLVHLVPESFSRTQRHPDRSVHSLAALLSKHVGVAEAVGPHRPFTVAVGACHA